MNAAAGSNGSAGGTDYITALNPNDVLFGRGSGPNDHEGNIRFRSLVGDRKGEYMATNHRQTKAKIARDIVDSVLTKNGRFLKKVEPAEAKRLGIPKGVDAWTIVDDETIMEKAKQALRQQRDKIKAPDEHSPHVSPCPAARRAGAVPRDVPSYVGATAAAAGAGRYGTDTQGVLRRPVQTAGGAAVLPTGAYGGGAAAAVMHPNPYEPIPIGTNAVVSEAPSHHTPSLDWRNFSAAINAQTLQGHLQQPYPTPQVDISNVAGMAMQQMQAPPDRNMPPDRVSQLNDMGGGARRESIQVHDLMDSFNKMKTNNLDKDPYEQSTDTLNTMNSRFNESTETMGTIEPLAIGPGKDVPSAAALSMSSSTFSFMKGALLDSARGADSTAMLKSAAESQSTVDSSMFSHMLKGQPDGARSSVARSARRESATRQSITIDDKEFFSKAKKTGASSSEMSMSLSQVWTDKKSNLGDVYEEDESGGRSEKKLPPRGDPRAMVAMEDDPDNLSTLGKSSMSILNVAMGESQGDTSIMTANESIFSDIGDVEGD